MQTIARDKKIAIVGLGKTGLSCVRFLSKLGYFLMVVDSREQPPGAEELGREFPEIEVHFGELSAHLLSSVDEIILSPGIAMSHASIRAAADAGVVIRGDIDVFVEYANAPLVAITGSNGKSTVTTLLGEMAKASGLQVGVGGNLGTPALDLLDENAELYVLELSSFQLETTRHLAADVCVLLNLSEDHMDRYDSKMQYLQAKQRIFFGAKHVVVNADDMLSQPLVAEGMRVSKFGLKQPDLNKFSIQEIGGDECLVDGFEPLLPVNSVFLKGGHNLSNALAAAALAKAAGIDREAVVAVLKTYQGLPHRCQWLGDVRGVRFIDDSKGTNPGATKVAIESFGQIIEGKVVLIAGGEGKGLDMSPLGESMSQYGRSVILIGRDAPKLASVFENVVPISYASTMNDAVDLSVKAAKSGDVVLLSPACASFDMFKSFEHRGEVFQAEVAAL